MNFSDYFQAELDYLRDLGAEFIKENPKLEPFLAPNDPDPDVKRLMEGFAFLTGRLRQKLDDEFPELTHSLMRVLWPHYLRPVPCMSVLEFRPVLGALTDRKLIPAGTEVDGRPLGDPPVRCHFRTSYDVELRPIAMPSVEYRNAGSGGMLELGIVPVAGANIERIGMDSVRLYLHGDRESAVGSVLYLWLCRYLAEIEVCVVLGDGKQVVRPHPVAALRPLGFGPDQTLLPWPENAFGGYRLLQEYFSLVEKFHFFDLDGLEFLRDLEWIERVNLRFRFTKPLDESVRVRAEHVRLHCTPIVNLFKLDGDPIRLDRRQIEYRVRPHSDAPRFHEVFSVDGVRGTLQGTSKVRRFVEFESFAHVHSEARGDDEDSETVGWYRLRLAPTVVGRGVETYLAFVDSAGSHHSPPMEVVSLELTCTNRNLPELLRLGDVDLGGSNAPEYAKFSNIVKPSPALAPPLDARLHWRLISNMALNRYSLTNVAALREILATYDFRALLDEQARRESAARIDGIVSIVADDALRLKRGLPVRGRRIQLELRERSFGGAGARGEAGMFLFATVLNEFFSLYASANSFHELHVRGAERREEYAWPRRDGLQPLL